MSWTAVRIPTAYFLILSCLYANSNTGALSTNLRSQEVSILLEKSCLIFADSDADAKVLALLDRLVAVFRADDHVSVGTIDVERFVWTTGAKLEWKSAAESKSKNVFAANLENPLGFFHRNKPDRSCLHKATPTKWSPRAERYTGRLHVQDIISYVNSQCGAFRMENGHLSIAGIHREDILANMFHIDKKLNSNMREIHSATHSPLNHISRLYHPTEADSSSSGSMMGSKTCDGQNPDMSCEDNTQDDKYSEPRKDDVQIGRCETITQPISEYDFFHNYLKRSRPVVIKDGAKHWKAFTKWTPEFFRRNFGDKKVHIKLTPGGDFEGVERADLWEDFRTFKIPHDVQSQLLYPDLVVVRPAPVNMNFSEFLDLITMAASQPRRNVSAYLEYSSIPNYMPELQADIEEFPFTKSLKREHLNLWLSDGNTIGKLHFDPYDNFLCQLRGRKEVILFEPYENQRLYEAHIPQATLSYNPANHQFRRRKLEDSTSMVMSPVDLLNPNFERFPQFAEVYPLNCTLDEGDVLFMPSFWWHEVYSWPNPHEKRNLAVNFWYAPFLNKEFPCPECPLDVNPHYHQLLD